MSVDFFEQPIELISNEQLVRLPIEDLLNACNSSTEFSDLCKNPQIWVARVQNEFPESVIPRGVNPREFYLRQKLFGGGIYIHTIDYSSIQVLDTETKISYDLDRLDAQTQQVAPEIIEYDNLFVRAEEIAQSLRPADKEYVIVYSHTQTEGKPGLNVVGYQVSDYLALVPGPTKKITLVDIIYVLPDSSVIWTVRDIRDFREALESNQPMVTVNGTRHRIGHVPMKIRSLFQSLESIGRALLKYHELADTAFYRREIDYLTTQRILTIESPKVPRSYEINTEISKDALLAFVIASVTQIDFLHASRNEPRLGFATYADFALFQENYINAMDNEQLHTLGILINGLLPIMETKRYDEIKEVKGFVFNSAGKIVIV